MNRRSEWHKTLALAASLLLITVGTGAGADWLVDQATLRYEVKLQKKPTHPEAGYFIVLDDGGVLPKPYPLVVAIDSKGNELESCSLWHNRSTGLAVLFAAPQTGGNVSLYLRSAPVLRKWSPMSKLKPSAIICTESGRGSRIDANALAGLGQVSTDAVYANRPGAGKAPLCVSGDLLGRDGDCSAYMLAHVNITDPGNTYVAPIVFAGETEIRINGTKLKPRKVNEKPGGTGANVYLKPGINRLEILCWNSTGLATRNGFMTMLWRTPKTTVAEMGGVRPPHLDYAGTPMWEARKLHKNEIVRSGSAQVVKATAQDGSPVPRFAVETLHNFWFGHEKPLNLCRLVPLPAGNPAGTEYEWEFDGGGRTTAKAPMWLFTGGRDWTVSLTAGQGGNSSTCSRTFYPRTTARTSLNDPATRDRYRQAALSMLEAYPETEDPTTDWHEEHWNNLFRNLDLNKGRKLLTHMVDRCWDRVEAKLTPDRVELLRELALDFAPRVDPEMALRWTQVFRDETQDPIAKGMMAVREAEIHMYYLQAPEKARSILKRTIAESPRGEIAEWAWIRLGDLAWIEGDLNDATRIYGEVQERAKDLEQGKDAGRGAGDRADRREAADWKVNALLDVCSSETTQKLVQEGFMLEAKRALQKWERKFPMSKVNSDYLVTESNFYMKLKDWKRAHAVLEPYCELLDASSFLPAAAEALLTCKIELKRPGAEIYDYAKRMKKKLEFHPVAWKFSEAMKKYEGQP